MSVECLPGLHRAEHALSAPNAGLGQSEYYPSFADKAAAMAFQLIKGHPLVVDRWESGGVCERRWLRELQNQGHRWFQRGRSIG